MARAGLCVYLQNFMASSKTFYDKSYLIKFMRSIEIQ